MSKLKGMLIFLRITRALLMVGAVTVTVFFLFLPDEKRGAIGEPHWEIISPELQDRIHEVLPASAHGRFIHFRTDLEVPMDLSFRLITLLFAYIVCGYGIYLVSHMGKVIHDIEREQPFTLVNTRRIKRIGLMIAGAPLIESLMHSVFSWWIRSRFAFDGLKLEASQDLGWMVFITGMIIYAFGIAFEQGVRMKEEQELTI